MLLVEADNQMLAFVSSRYVYSKFYPISSLLFVEGAYNPMVLHRCHVLGCFDVLSNVPMDCKEEK